MRSVFAGILSVILFAVVVGCAHEHQPKIGMGRVTHVVVCWLKQPGDARARQELIDASESFRSLPGVEEVLVGRPLPSTRPVVDSSYDLSVVMVFKDVGALKAYESSPLHQQAVRDVLMPLVARYVVYDSQERSLMAEQEAKN